MTLYDPLSGLRTQPSEATTIRHLVDTIGPPLLHVVVAPRGLEHRVRGSVLHDPLDELLAGRDELLLLSGTQVDDPAALEMLRIAAERGFHAVVIKLRGAAATSFIEEAISLNVAVLAVADTVPWRKVDSLILSVIASQGVSANAEQGADGELFALANAIAAVVGGAVTIEGTDRRILAHSSLPGQRIDELRQRGILERRVPDMDRNPGQYRAVLVAPSVVRFPEVVDELPRSAIAVMAGSQPLGTIWAIESADGLSPEGERSLIDGARLAALYILRTRNAAELTMHAREGALRGILDGSITAQDLAFHLSLSAGTELALLGFATSADAAGESSLVSRVSEAVFRYVTVFRPDAAMSTTPRAVYVLLPGGGQGAAFRLAHGAVAALRASFGDRVRVAIARDSTNPAQIPAMRREVDDVLRVTTIQADLPAVAQFADVHSRVFLAHVADELQREPTLRHPGVVSMAAYDLEQGTSYSLSLGAWLDAMGDVATASAVLGVHPNTLRYRLRRSADLFDITLDNPDDRLAAWVQLRLGQDGRIGLTDT